MCGATAISYNQGTVYTVVDLDHAWLKEITKPNETTDLHVLVGNAEYTEYYDAHVG